MKINAGLVPFSQLFYADLSAVEAGAHNIGAAFTDIVLLDLGTRALNDRIFVSTIVKATKGANAGGVEQQIWKNAGTATIFTLNDYQSIHRRQIVQAAESFYWYTTGFFRVTVAGTLTLALSLYSENSNINTLPDTGRIQVFIARGR